MSHSLHSHIQEYGFESTLGELIDFSETQARLHHALGDRTQWEYWVKNWVSLRKASDTATLASHDHWLDVWMHHINGYSEAFMDVNCPEISHE